MASFLTKQQLWAYLSPAEHGVKPLVENLIDSAVQVQQAGIDLSLQRLFEAESAATLAFTQAETTLPIYKELEFDSDGKIFLSPGCYKAWLNEIVNIPKNLLGIARPRSTLARSGASVVTALWDPGYSGRSEVLLVVHNPHGLTIKRNTRILQLCFCELDQPLSDDDQYQGRYQLENLN